MDRTSALVIQKCTGFPGACHFQIWQDDAVYHLELQMGCQKFIKGLPEAGSNPVDIQGIQHDRGSHAPAAGRAALAAAAVCPDHILALIKFTVRYLVEIQFS